MRTFLLIGILIITLSAQTATAQESANRSSTNKSGAMKNNSRNRQQRHQPRQARNATPLIKRFDKNGDGLLENKEVPAVLRRRFAQLDQNKDGKLSRSELRKSNGQWEQRTGEVITGPARNERLKVGDTAPDFTLADPTGNTKVTLSSFQGKKPVVLIFGSYT